MHTEIFADGFRDKIFDTDIVAALVHALGDTDSDVSSSVVKFFTAATAQGALRSFHGITRYSHQNIPRGVSGHDI